MSEHNPTPLSPRTTKIVITAFLGGLIVVTWLVLSLVTGNGDSLRAPQLEIDAFYTCTDVLSGDTIVVKKSSTTNAPQIVHLIGIQAPPLAAGAELDAFARTIGKQPAEVLDPSDSPISYGEVAQRTLKGFLLRQNLKLTFPDPGVPRVFIDCSGTEVSRKILREGQAIVRDDPNERRSEYESCMDEAQAKQIGIWR